MLDLLNRHIVQPALAAKRGSKHFQHFKQFLRTQYDSAGAVQARQLAMLQVQLHHAYATVPYYRRVWQSLGLHPAAVKTLADLEQFPVLTKQDIRTHAAELRSVAYLNRPCRLKSTSGSTGVPLKIWLDEPGAQWKYGCVLRADEWSGWRLGQRVAKVWGNPEYRHFGMKGRLMNHFVDRARYLDTINLTEERLKAFVVQLRRHRAGLIFGHAHSLYMLACALKKSGIDDIRPNGIISTAMPLHGYQRTVLEEVFGVPATNRYGCEEVSLIACECERHQGLHVAAESIFTEVRRALPGASRTTGPLLITDLSNFAMPLIRYQIGDVVTLSATPCPCGRGLPSFERVEGREADYVVTPAGALISGISLTENFAVLIQGAAQVQIVQETRTHLCVRMVRDANFNSTSEQQIRDLVLNTFGPTMTYDLDFVEMIPQEPSGKYRFCVSKVADEFLKGLSA
jgi:phenylacetate-CoA ligase